MRFWGLNPGVASPDAKAIWLFRERLVQARAIDKLLALLDARLRASGYLAQSGQIIDATVMAAPSQHLSDEEKPRSRKARQQQSMVPTFGYKNHTGIDRTFGFIRKWVVTHAARHGSGSFEDVLDAENIARSVWADTAYRSAKNERGIRRAKLKSMIHFRKPRLRFDQVCT
jgi:IS5 family transposase